MGARLGDRRGLGDPDDVVPSRMQQLLIDGLLYWILGLSAGAGLLCGWYHAGREISMGWAVATLVGMGLVVGLLAGLWRDPFAGAIGGGPRRWATPAWQGATPEQRQVYRVIAGGCAAGVFWGCSLPLLVVRRRGLVRRGVELDRDD